MQRPCTADQQLLEICMDVFSETLNTKPLKKRYRKAERYKKELFTCNFQGFAKGLSNFDHDFFL